MRRLPIPRGATALPEVAQPEEVHSLKGKIKRSNTPRRVLHPDEVPQSPKPQAPTAESGTTLDQLRKIRAQTRKKPP